MERVATILSPYSLDENKMKNNKKITNLLYCSV